MPDAADAFLAESKRRDPDRFAEVAGQYPVISARAKRRDRRGRTYEPTDKREPLSENAKQRYRDQRAARKAELREWAVNYHYALELADEGL